MNNVLQAGAVGCISGHGSDWRSMNSAPRDGTIIEIKCSYGVAPHYNLYKWTSYSGGGMKWVTASNSASALSSDLSCTWRPYSGEVEAYVDPTGGMQNDMAYWRGAVAQKYGLPLDHFEKEAKSNRQRNERAENPPQWWQFWK